ncbi:MAG: site-specific integrase [Sedimentisphaerales bacterium]|nr:site-specific integrase [Sedimentisphaerales bacterium]
MSNLKLNGSIYCRKGRWWWKVKLPGQSKFTYHPLRPKGAKFATKDRTIAEQVAQELWVNMLSRSDRKITSVTDIASLICAYSDFAKVYYRKADGTVSGEVDKIRYACAPLNKHYGELPVEEFGPLKLQELRQHIIGLNLCRKVVNERIRIIKRMFRWAVSNELIPVFLYQAITAVEDLKRGRSGARESKKVLPVAKEHVMVILPYTTQVVADMIRLQDLTGMRSSEVCNMRPCDVDTAEDVWVYRPYKHKTENYGYSKEIYIGPKGQEILLPYLARKRDTYCFTPAESEAQRKRKNCHQALRDKFDKDSYRRAVKYAIAAARKAGEGVKEWTPHQLRHKRATEVRNQFGLEAAKVLLGHQSLSVTESYTVPEKRLAIEAATQLG